MKKIELGNSYTDKIHGFTGIATAITKYLIGCDRVCLETLKDGVVTQTWFDIMLLKNVKIPKKDKKPRGPQPTPSSKPVRSR